MPPTIYEVARLGNGVLSIMAKPVSGEWIAEEFAGLKGLGVNIIVSLLEYDEASEVGLSGEKEHCENSQIGFIQFPIVDRGLPDRDEARKLVKSLYAQILDGKHVVVHCRIGIGRAGIITGAILKEGRKTAAQAIQMISGARRVQVPDTEAQVKWLEDY